MHGQSSSPYRFWLAPSWQMFPVADLRVPCRDFGIRCIHCNAGLLCAPVLKSYVLQWEVWKIPIMMWTCKVLTSHVAGLRALSGSTNMFCKPHVALRPSYKRVITLCGLWWPPGDGYGGPQHAQGRTATVYMWAPLAGTAGRESGSYLHWINGRSASGCTASTAELRIHIAHVRRPL